MIVGKMEEFPLKTRIKLSCLQRSSDQATRGSQYFDFFTRSFDTSFFGFEVWILHLSAPSEHRCTVGHQEHLNSDVSANAKQSPQVRCMTQVGLGWKRTTESLRMSTLSTLRVWYTWSSASPTKKASENKPLSYLTHTRTYGPSGTRSGPERFHWYLDKQDPIISIVPIEHFPLNGIHSVWFLRVFVDLLN